MQTPADLASLLLPVTFLSPQGLFDRGLSRHRIACLVADGQLLRLRNGRYVDSAVDHELVRAGMLGGRLDCVSLLAALNVFVRVAPASLHLQFEKGTTRLPKRPAHITAHWRRSATDRCALAADIVEALAQACTCQSPHDAIATLDSAWHHELVDEADIDAIFSRLPARYRPLRHQLDRRSESGSETIMRLMLLSLGAQVDLQVRIPGVGRVDLVVNGWLIIECDSRAHHEGWAAQKRDRERDLAAAALGYTTLRPIAEDILFRTDSVRKRMREVLTHPPRRARLQNSTHRPAKRRRVTASAP